MLVLKLVEKLIIFQFQLHFMGKNGGARPGAGRKKGGHNKIPSSAIEARKMLEQKVMDNFEPLLDAWMTLAKGDFIYQGRERLYHAKPDSQALRNIMEFLMGKPKQEIASHVDGTLETPGLTAVANTMRAIIERNSK